LEDHRDTAISGINTDPADESMEDLPGAWDIGTGFRYDLLNAENQAGL
jgi:hypothetical protein